VTVPTAAEFFANLDPDDEVERVGGLPKIRPAGAPEGAPLVPYTRASSLADYISDHRYVHRWEMRYLCKAMGQNPDLAELAAVETYYTGSDEPVRSDKSASGRRLDAIIARALDRAKISQKADRGTAIHAATEPGNREPVPESLRPDVVGFKQAIVDAGGEILQTEVFTACDEVQSAGTFDHLVRFPRLGVVILDKKTGNEQPHEFGVQFSVYAHADVYNPRTHERMPLDDLDPQLGPGVGGVRQDVAIAAMIKGGRTRFVEIDIEKGWQGAKVAAAARDYVEDRDLSADATQRMLKDAREVRGIIADHLARATTPERLEQLWQDHRALWTDEHTQIAKARKAYLTEKR